MEVRNPHTASLPISGIQLGAGTLLVPFDSLHSIFAPVGFSERAFEYFLRALGLAWIEGPRGLKLINYFKFILAIETATLTGELPFRPLYGPTSLPVHYNHEAKGKLTTEDYERLWKRAVSELLLVRRLPGLLNPPAIKEALDGAAKSIITQVARATAAAVDFTALQAQEEADSILNPSEVDKDGPLSYTPPDPPVTEDKASRMEALKSMPQVSYTVPPVNLSPPPPEQP